MARTPRSRLHNDARRAQLLDMGVALFGQRSYDEVSIDEIAEEAGISRGLLYHYFGGKRAFYLACIEVAASQLLDVLSFDSRLTGVERVTSGLNAYLDWVSERSGGYLALMRGGVDGSVAVILEQARATLVARMIEGMALSGPGPFPGFTTAAYAWLGAVEAAAACWLDRPDLSRDALVSLLVANLLGSLAGAALLHPDAGFTVDPLTRTLLQQLC
ncbi:MAG: AcrR family transcriptional regulator [Myxococcota bacterium]|jgi:AcrR family transcriptional regulator